MYKIILKKCTCCLKKSRCYQIQYINIEVRNADISLILNSTKKQKNRALKRKHRATIFRTAERENINTQQIEKYRMQIFLGLLNMKI